MGVGGVSKQNDIWWLYRERYLGLEVLNTFYVFTFYVFHKKEY